MTDKLMIKALRGEKTKRPPIWLMRQAGRYLPEYRATRQKAKGFLELCYNPELATEVTLQPIHRFGFDASILFSDILVVPHALGQKVWFEEGQGPKLDRLQKADDIRKLNTENFHSHLEPVYETIERLKERLPQETTLIGFAGAPWTVVSYMIEGGSSKDYTQSKTWAFSNEESFKKLIDLVTIATADYLIEQINRGAETVQIFDSWAGVWPEEYLKKWCLNPCKDIIKAIKKVHPDIPVILFPRMVGSAYKIFAQHSGADALSLDTTVPLSWACSELQKNVTIQGNLDPLVLVAGGQTLDQEVDRILNHLSNGPFIFNLGHGIVPQTPPEHVAQLIERIHRVTA